MGDKLAIYTMAIGGDYDLPSIQPQQGIDYFCFTDQHEIESNDWTIREVSSIIPSDTFRSSRDFKVRPHRWLREYSRSIYIDSNVHLLLSPQVLWDYLIPNERTVFGGFFHSFRETVADEFAAVQAARLDYEETIRFQLETYRAHHRAILTSKPVWGGILARRHNDAFCVDAMEVWYSNILRFSRRDQLSLPLALSQLSRDQKNFALDDIHMTKFHSWPVTSKPKPSGYRIDEGAPPLRERKTLMSKRIQKFKRSLEKRNLLPARWRGTRHEAPLKTNPSPVTFGFDKERSLYFAEDGPGPKRVFVSDKKRLDLYKGGIEHRLEWILRDYRLPVDLIAKDDVVVDVGANIGELGIWADACGGHYIGFEPDPSAFSALQLNVPNGQLHDVALSDSNGMTTFYLNTAEADSSLFKPSDSEESITVRMATLDSFFEEVGAPLKIRLLKVEAEGMEPEVLSGALETLGIVEYVAVDAGPERGGENTVPDVLKILIEAGFEVLDCYLLRGTFLLKKM